MTIWILRSHVAFRALHLTVTYSRHYITYAYCTIIEPPLQIRRLLDFCWTQILTFRPGFFADQCAFTVVWSPYFCFEIFGPQTIAVAREQF